MTGTIGLTLAAAYLETYMEEQKRPYAVHVLSFAVRMTTRIGRIRKSIQGGSKDDAEYVFRLVQADYKQQITALATKIGMTEFEKSILFNHLHSITRYDFIPATRTQEALRRKAKIAESSASSCLDATKKTTDVTASSDGTQSAPNHTPLQSAPTELLG